MFVCEFSLSLSLSLTLYHFTGERMLARDSRGGRRGGRWGGRKNMRAEGASDSKKVRD